MRAIPASNIFVRDLLSTTYMGSTGYQSNLTTRLPLKLEHIRFRYRSLAEIRVYEQRNFEPYRPLYFSMSRETENCGFCRPPSFTSSSSAPQNLRPPTVGLLYVSGFLPIMCLGTIHSYTTNLPCHAEARLFRSGVRFMYAW